MTTLRSLCCLLLLSLARCMGDPRPARDPGSPVANLRLDPRKKLLTWIYTRNVSQDQCVVSAPPDALTKLSPSVREDHSHFCKFPNNPLHRGARLTVRGVATDGDEFEEALAFENPGKEGSAATNFACFIYNIRFMNCSWAPGPSAPRDVRYHLYYWFSSDDDEAECTQYVLNLMGTRVGCHFNQLGKPKNSENYFFLVNGTSSETAIPFLDFVPFVPDRNEKYNPPENVTVSYEGPSPVIRWGNPDRRYDMAVGTFLYELDIRRKGSSQKPDPIFQRGKDHNEYRVPSSQSRTENTVRLRVRHRFGEIWSEWSETLPFGTPEDGHSRVTVLLVLVVGAAALSTAILMLLCKRYSNRLFAPIPQVKGDLAGVFLSIPEVTWAEASPTPHAQEPEEVLTVQEIP